MIEADLIAAIQAAVPDAKCILAYWEMRSGRNLELNSTRSAGILAYWEMRSGRNGDLAQISALHGQQWRQDFNLASRCGCRMMRLMVWQQR